ncbi:MAG TPA: metallophosphoesterase [Geobacteraceae bacterium]
MKIIVIADTHGNIPLVVRALDEAGAVDLLIHLGDVVEDCNILEALVACPIYRVAGNCDVGSPIPRELCCSVGGVAFLLTHGDAYHVKAGLAKLQARARALQVQVVLYGHTHRAADEEIDGIRYINPGTLHKGSTSWSYAIVTIATGTVTARILPLVPPA